MEMTFGELLAEAMARKGLSDYKLSAAIGLLPGNRVFNNVQIRRLRLGERKHMSPELLERLIQVLDLPEDEAYHAAGLWPPGLDVDRAHPGLSPERQAAPHPVRDAGLLWTGEGHPQIECT